MWLIPVSLAIDLLCFSLLLDDAFGVPVLVFPTFGLGMVVQPLGFIQIVVLRWIGFKQTAAMAFSLIVLVNLRYKAFQPVMWLIFPTFSILSFCKVNGWLCRFGERLKLNSDKMSAYMYGSKLVGLNRQNIFPRIFFNIWCKKNWL